MLCLAVAVVLDFSDLSQLDLAAYSTHRLLGDIGEVLGAYCPWLVYKIVVFRLQFAKDLLWEVLRYWTFTHVVVDFHITCRAVVRRRCVVETLDVDYYVSLGSSD